MDHKRERRRNLGSYCSYHYLCLRGREWVLFYLRLSPSLSLSLSHAQTACVDFLRMNMEKNLASGPFVIEILRLLSFGGFRKGFSSLSGLKL